MKSIHSAEFYKENKERFRKQTKMDLDAELSRFVKGLDLPEQALAIVRKVYAKEIADRATAEVKERMAMIQSMERGDSTLGYTTQGQEVSERSRIRFLWEYDCYQLSEFRKKWEV